MACREGAYTWIRGQWRVGRGHIPGSGINGVKGGGIYPRIPRGGHPSDAVGGVAESELTNIERSLFHRERRRALEPVAAHGSVRAVPKRKQTRLVAVERLVVGSPVGNPFLVSHG
eukprot:1196294-Prorocentrum_minimum.AAC.10